MNYIKMLGILFVVMSGCSFVNAMEKRVKPHCSLDKINARIAFAEGFDQTTPEKLELLQTYRRQILRREANERVAAEAVRELAERQREAVARAAIAERNAAKGIKTDEQIKARFDRANEGPTKLSKWQTLQDQYPDDFTRWAPECIKIMCKK